MDWRLKCLAFWMLALPGLGPRLHYLAQRRLTRSLPRRVDEASLAHSRRHLANFLRFGQAPLAQAHHYEFGVGWDLMNALCLRAAGLGRQTCVDLSPLARPELINATLAGLNRLAPPDLPGLPLKPVGERLAADLQRLHGIAYLAPADARHLPLAPASVDYISSTQVLEHVPAAEIPPILAECRRVLKPGGVASLEIDYADHYANADPALSPYHFLRYPEGAWRVFNPPLQFQNRLRHADHRRLCREAGLTILAEETLTPPDGVARLAREPLAARFAGRPPAELAVTRGVLVLGRAG